MCITHLMKARILDVVGSNFFFTLDLHTDVQSNGTGHSRLVGTLLEIVPNLHFTRQRSHLDDRLPKKVIRLPGQLLAQSRL